MYKKILVPTDGSELSKLAVEHGVALAAKLGASIVGLTITLPLSAYSYTEAMIAIDPVRFEANAREMAAERLAVLEAAAKEAGVACNTRHLEADAVHQAIIDSAQSEGCDLIVMASHGRSGFSAFVLGSETTKVLTHSKIPVLVYR